MQLLHLLTEEEQRVGSAAMTQGLRNGNTVTNGNFTLIVKSNHTSKERKKLKKTQWADLKIKWRKKKTTKRSLTQAVEIRLMLRT